MFFGGPASCYGSWIPWLFPIWYGWWNPGISVQQALEIIQQSELPITPNKGSREAHQRWPSHSFSLSDSQLAFLISFCPPATQACPYFHGWSSLMCFHSLVVSNLGFVKNWKLKPLTLGNLYKGVCGITRHSVLHIVHYTLYSLFFLCFFNQHESLISSCWVEPWHYYLYFSDGETEVLNLYWLSCVLCVQKTELESQSRAPGCRPKRLCYLSVEDAASSFSF